MTKQKMKEVFEKAKRKIEVDGWYHPTMLSGNCNCAFTAMMPLTADLKRVSEFFIEVNNIPYDPHCFGIPAWNDAPERTKDDVLKAFDKAIEACGVEG